METFEVRLRHPSRCVLSREGGFPKLPDLVGQRWQLTQQIAHNLRARYLGVGQAFLPPFVQE